MREAIGQVYTLQIILVFVLLINGYMAYSVNYTRAFRVKNQIINYIEQYEGAEGKEVQTKIADYTKQMTYNVSNQQITTYKNNHTDAVCQNDWCYIPHSVNKEEADGTRQGKYYTVTTFVNIDIPVINNLIGPGSFLEVKGETKTIYTEE